MKYKVGDKIVIKSQYAKLYEFYKGEILTVKNVFKYPKDRSFWLETNSAWNVPVKEARRPTKLEIALYEV